MIFLCSAAVIALIFTEGNIELEVQEIDHMGQFVIMYVNLIENVSESDSLIVRFGDNLEFQAYYYKAIRPENNFEKNQMEFLNLPLQDRVCFWFDPDTADSLGLQNFEDIKGFISSEKIILTKK